MLRDDWQAYGARVLLRQKYTETDTSLFLCRVVIYFQLYMPNELARYTEYFALILVKYSLQILE